MKQKNWLFKAFVAWLPLAVVITGICGLIYIVEQQHCRMAANSPQIGLAQQVAAAREQGQLITSFIDIPFDIAGVQAPWIIVYDNNQLPVAASGLLNGKIPLIPQGVLDNSRDLDLNKVTWQPEPGVRQAIVVKYFTDNNGVPGYVVAGRSLTETEIQIEKLGLMVGLAYLALLVTTFVVVAGSSKFNPA